MSNSAPDPVEIISAQLYAFLLTSPKLGKDLLPEGLTRSPYRVLSFDGLLDLADKRGRVAVFHRSQKVKFQQQGVRAILDHFWGSGITNVGYSTTAGTLGDLIHDQGRRHQVIELPHAMNRSDELEFNTERAMMETFLSPNGHFELVIDHPIDRLSHAVLFPRGRPCQTAELVLGHARRPLTVETLPGGRTLIRVGMPHAHAHTAYRVEWLW